VKQDDLQKIFLPHQPASLWEGEFPELAKNERIFFTGFWWDYYCLRINKLVSPPPSAHWNA
jgi:hypothetical protein